MAPMLPSPPHLLRHLVDSSGLVIIPRSARQPNALPELDRWQQFTAVAVVESCAAELEFGEPVGTACLGLSP